MAIAEDGDWPDTRMPQNILDVYRQDGLPERSFVETVTGASHEGRLFLNSKCMGQRVSYTATHVNMLLTREENPEGIKERIVTLIPRLSSEQKQWLAQGISDAALRVVRAINADTASLIASYKIASLPVGAAPTRGI